MAMERCPIVLGCSILVLILSIFTNKVPSLPRAWRIARTCCFQRQSCRRASRVPKLEARLQDLIEFARNVAEEKGVFTETQAAQRRQLRRQELEAWKRSKRATMWQAILEGRKKMKLDIDERIRMCYTDQDCGHGACRSGSCICVAGFAGSQCSYPIHIIDTEALMDGAKLYESPLSLGFDHFSGVVRDSCDLHISVSSDGGLLLSGNKDDILQRLQNQEQYLNAHKETYFRVSNETLEGMDALDGLLLSLQECIKVNVYAPAHMLDPQFQQRIIMALGPRKKGIDMAVRRLLDQLSRHDIIQMIDSHF